MTRLILFAGLLAALALAAPAAATHDQPPLDINQLDYEPVGHYKAGDPLPAADSCEEEFLPQLDPARPRTFNPSGEWNSFDNELFEVICLPYRQSGDTSDSDPYGNGGDPRHGYCAQPHDPVARPGNPAYAPGVCPNHQLEWSAYYADTMREVLGDFGVTIRQHFFEVDVDEISVPPANTMAGRAINTAAVVPGADHPEDTVIVGAHYDQTNDGPASAWDSQEGHAEMIRMAKLMADYWRRTGTRPSATVKFIPWDGEESGTLGSLDYAENNVVPGQAGKVRGYWNTDPCAGGYPSYVTGNPAERLTMGIQLGDVADIDPDISTDAARVERFNERAPALVEQILEKVDDTVPTIAGDVETFIAASEGTSDLGGDIAIGFDQPVLFSSDWRNFIRLGIPFFNPGPEVTGPGEDSEGNLSPGGPALALVGFHSPLDNLQTMMQFTGPPPAGVTITDSWAKGMEFCANMLSWGMLQHDQGGAQTASTDPVAYYEALPNEAEKNAPVKFDATGSYQYADVATRKLVDDDLLEYRWDFGDGSPTHYGKVTSHAYARPGVYQSKLTVENIASGRTDSMTIPITVEPSNLAPGEAPPVGSPKPRPGGGGGAGQGCPMGFVSVKARPSGRGIMFDWQRVGDSIVKIDVRRVTARRSKSVRRFSVSEPFTWDGELVKGNLRGGVYEVRVGTLGETRRFTFLLGKKRRLKRVKRVAVKPTCGTVRKFAASAPAFRKKLRVAYTLGIDARASVNVLRGKKTVQRFKERAVTAGKPVRHRIRTERLRRGTYRFVLTVKAGGETIRRSVWARRL